MDPRSRSLFGGSVDAITRFSQHTMRGPGTCVFWKRHRNADGYPQFWLNGRAWYAHRWVFYVVVERREPNPEMDVHHKCGNRACVNPSCLEEVPALEHRTEAVTRGRHRV